MENVKTSAQVKQSNVRLIRNSLMDSECLTKKEISERTGLSLATCTVLLADLIESKQVKEIESDVPKGGRPARRFSINTDYLNILCVYLDNNTSEPGIQCRVYNIRGEVVDQSFIGVPHIGAGSIKNLIGSILKIHSNIGIIGIGISGYENAEGFIEHCDFSELIGVRLRELIQNEFGIKVEIGNDLYYISYGFYINSNHKKPFSVSVSLWPELALGGAGSVINGQILVGSTNFAGEISNLAYPFSKDKQMEILKSKRNIQEVITPYLVSNIVLLNPDVMYLTGHTIQCVSVNDLVKWCRTYIPEIHIPEFHIQSDVYNEYMSGLFSLTRNAVEFPHV